MSKTENAEIKPGTGLYNMGWRFMGHYLTVGDIEECPSARYTREERLLGLESGESI
jgi:hypothetical protein